MRAMRDELTDFRTCLHCGYDLRGLAASGRRGRCAECGEQIDPRTLVIPAWRWREWPRVWNLPFYLFGFLCGFALLVMSRAMMTPHSRAVFAAMGGLVMGGMLWSVFKFVWRVRGRAEGKLVVSRRSIAFVRTMSRRSIAYRNVSWFRLRQISLRYWRVKLSILGSGVDVMIQGDRRRMAAIRAVLKQRMGHTGITGWGTRRRNRWSLPARQGGWL